MSLTMDVFLFYIQMWYTGDNRSVAFGASSSLADFLGNWPALQWHLLGIAHIGDRALCVIFSYKERNGFVPIGVG